MRRFKPAYPFEEISMSRPQRRRSCVIASTALLAIALPASPAISLEEGGGSSVSQTALGGRGIIDPSTVSTDNAPAIAATQNYRQFPFAISLPSGSASAGTARTLLMSYNVNMDSGALAEKLQTKRSTDGGFTWTNLPQAVPMTTTVRTKTGLLYSVNFRTSSTSTPPTPIGVTPAPVLEKSGVAGNDTAPTLSDAASGAETKPTYAPEADVSLKRFTTRYWTSTDNGATWATAAGTASVPWSVTDLYFHRSIVIAPSGQWLATAYAHKTGDAKWSSFLLSSNDQGKTWQGVSEIGTRLISWGEGVTEPTIEFNSRGQLMVAYRMAGQINPSVCQGSTSGNASVATAVSNDLGKTWTNAHQVVVPGAITGSSDPHLVRSPTGQMLLSVGRPYNQILVSQDGTGDSWNPSISSAAIRSSGYTSLVNTGYGNQFRQFGDLGSNWCYSSADGPTRTAGIYTVPFYLRPADGQVLDLGHGLRTGRMQVINNTMSARLTGNTAPAGLADSSVEPDTGLVSPGTSGTYTLDLGNYSTVRGVGLAMPTAGAAATVQLSSDGVNWTSAATWARSDAYRALTDRRTTPTRTRYIRVSTSASAQALVSEMRVYTDYETFETDIPDGQPAVLQASGTNTNATVMTKAGQGYQSTNGVRITDNSTVSMPRLTKTITPTWNTFTGFQVNPSSLKTAITITQSVRMPDGSLQRGMHLGLFPDGSVRRYNGSIWITVAPAGSVPLNQWSYFSVYTNHAGSEFNINGRLYSNLPRTYGTGGNFVETTISAGGTATVGDNFLIDDLSQR